MTAYLVAQFIDIRLFHFWRRLTDGRHLWLRNNASTFASQSLDTFVVLALLATFAESSITWDRVPALFFNGILFKWAFALVDTPLFYLATHLCRRRFGALRSTPSTPSDRAGFSPAQRLSRDAAPADARTDAAPKRRPRAAPTTTRRRGVTRHHRWSARKTHCRGATATRLARTGRRAPIVVSDVSRFLAVPWRAAVTPTSPPDTAALVPRCYVGGRRPR